jgi:acetyl-CoA acetyltransferase family protein
MSASYIVAALRSPIGIGKASLGSLHSFSPIKLAAHILVEAIIEHASIDPHLIDDVIMGCVSPIGLQGANIGRLATLQAGFPVSVPAVQINRMCGSSQQAVHFASQAIQSGDMDVVIAAGIEMMSHVPIGSDWPEEWPDDFPYEVVHQGYSAELMAEKWNLSRDELDDYAYESHLRAGIAIREDKLSSQIVPIPVGHPTDQVIKQDQGVRLSPDRVKMASLTPVFKEDGVVTAGNSSQISDGAGAILLVSERALREYKLVPMARVVTRVVVGTDPVLMLDGPITATRDALEKSNLSLAEIDLIEINEAFASVVLAWRKETEADLEKVNLHGGAIAHGHPLGATGAILMTKLVHQLVDTGGKFGLQTMCIGHGMATGTIIENLRS